MVKYRQSIEIQRKLDGVMYSQRLKSIYCYYFKKTHILKKQLIDIDIDIYRSKKIVV